jgi:hypothetical protein
LVKSLQLLQSNDAIASAPGHATGARTVKSFSKVGFHLVVPGKGGRFTCDCQNYRSLNLCSHAGAVAELNLKQVDFIQ